MKKQTLMLIVVIFFLPLILVALPLIHPDDSIGFLNIPERSENAVNGTDFTAQITGLSLEDREIAIVEEILSGNVPSFSRKLKLITINKTIDSDQYELKFYSVCDYMAVGSDQDYLYVPMTPSTAQYLADRLDCSLPTSKMVDIIYEKAGLKLNPQPIPPSDEMITVPVFSQHTASIMEQISEIGYDRTADSIIAGHKKDIIISNKIYSQDVSYERVVIYGWHLSLNNPIQPVYNGHHAIYADYSHGVRLIRNKVYINGDSSDVKEIFQDSQLFSLLSNEGVITVPYYPASELFPSTGNKSENYPAGFELHQNYPNPFNSRTTICYQIPEPALVRISLYDLNGNSVETLFNGHTSKGYHRIDWHGAEFSSGVYYYNVSSDNFAGVKKCLLIK